MWWADMPRVGSGSPPRSGHGGLPGWFVAIGGVPHRRRDDRSGLRRVALGGASCVDDHDRRGERQVRLIIADLRSEVAMEKEKRAGPPRAASTSSRRAWPSASSPPWPTPAVRNTRDPTRTPSTSPEAHHDQAVTLFTRAFWVDAGERALKSAAQAVLGVARVRPPACSTSSTPIHRPVRCRRDRCRAVAADVDRVGAGRWRERIAPHQQGGLTGDAAQAGSRAG